MIKPTEMTGQWTVKVWDGFSNNEFQRQGTYAQVANSCASYPPGYIWSVSRASEAEMRLDQSDTQPNNDSNIANPHAGANVTITNEGGVSLANDGRGLQVSSYVPAAESQKQRTATPNADISFAKGYLERAGYTVSSHENGHLIVADPVKACGHGPNAGKLIPAGSQPVAVRSSKDAIRFVNARS